MKFEHNNISPLDSRYASKIPDIRSCFSEHALIQTRFNIEIDWFIYLCDKYPNYFMKLANPLKKKLLSFKSDFNDKDVIKIKEIERQTNHDVKAIEYFISNFFKKDKVLLKYTHLIHFGLTSEDINSLAYAIMIKEGVSLQYKKIFELNKDLKSYSRKWNNISFLARTILS